MAMRVGTLQYIHTGSTKSVRMLSTGVTTYALRYENCISSIFEMHVASSDSSKFSKGGLVWAVVIVIWFCGGKRGVVSYTRDDKDKGNYSVWVR